MEELLLTDLISANVIVAVASHGVETQRVCGLWIGSPGRTVQTRAAARAGVVHAGINHANSARKGVNCMFPTCWGLQTASPV